MKSKLAIIVLLAICCVGCGQHINSQSPTQEESAKTEDVTSITKDGYNENEENVEIVGTKSDYGFQDLPLQDPGFWTFEDLMNSFPQSVETGEKLYPDYYGGSFIKDVFCNN